MIANHSYKLQKAFRDFASIDRWHAPYAVTLTMKPSLPAERDSRLFRRILTPDEARTNFRHFMNVLNRKVLGKPASRFGQRLQVVPVLEGGNGKHLHYHAVIDCLRDDLRDAFPSIVRTAWNATDWGNFQTDIQSDADNGWIRYISKFRDKANFADAIDWTNCHID